MHPHLTVYSQHCYCTHMHMNMNSNPSPIAVLPNIGEAPTLQGRPMGTTRLPLQSWEQTRRRELWPGLQRYTLHGCCHGTSEEIHNETDKGWKITIHSCYQTSKRCTYIYWHYIGIMLTSTVCGCLGWNIPYTHHNPFLSRRCSSTRGGELPGGDCHDEEGILWGVLPCGPDGGLCLHCTATCTGPGVCSLWRPPLLPQVLEAEGKLSNIIMRFIYTHNTHHFYNHLCSYIVWNATLDKFCFYLTHTHIGHHKMYVCLKCKRKVYIEAVLSKMTY